MTDNEGRTACELRVDLDGWSGKIIAEITVPCPECNAEITFESMAWIKELPEHWSVIERCDNCGKPFEAEGEVTYEVAIWALKRKVTS